MFDMNSMTESETKKILTKDEREKLEKLDPNKIDNIPVDSTSRRDKSVLYFDNTLGKYSHSELIDGKMIASYTGDNIKRIDMIKDVNFNTKPAYIYLDSITEQIYRWHRPSLAFFEYRGQKVGNGIFPLSPVDGQDFIGLETVYTWDNNVKAWLIKSTKLENQSVIRMTWEEYGVWVNENPKGTGVFYIIQEGKLIDYYDGIGVESASGRGYNGGTRPTLLTDKNKLFIDADKKIVYKWNAQFKYWEVVVSKYIDGFLDMKQTVDGIVRYRFNTIVGSNERETWSIQYDAINNKMVSWLTSTRMWQHVKVLWNKRNDSENIEKIQGFTASQTLPLPDVTEDGVEGEVEFTCQKSKITGMAFGYRFIKYQNNFFITDKWMVDFERQNSYPLNCSFTSLEERQANTITRPDTLREYWDRGLNEMLLYDFRGVWRSFDQKFEDVVFPKNPTNGQEFTSTLKDLYKYDATNAYWKLVQNNYFEVRTKEVIQCTRNGNQTIASGSRWDINLVSNQVGSNLSMNSSGITIPANTTVHLRADLSFYTNDTASNFATLGFYNATKSSWLKCSKATIWGSSWNYQPNRAIDAYYTTGNTAETIDIRCSYYGFGTNGTVSIVGNNGTDTSANSSANTGGSSYFSCEIINEYISEKTKLDGVYGDYLQAILNNNYQGSVSSGVSFNFGNIKASFGGIVKVNEYTYRLQPNKVYKITSQISCASGTYVTFGIYDVQSNVLLGTHGHARNANSTDAISSSCDAIAIVNTGNVYRDVCVKAISTSGTPIIYSSNADIGMSNLLIEELGGTQRIVDASVTVANKQNYATVSNGSPIVGDLWRENDNEFYLSKTSGTKSRVVTDDWYARLKYECKWADFSSPSGSTANEYTFGGNIKSYTNVSVLKSSGNILYPTFNSNGQITLPKGVWTINFTWNTVDSPDTTNDWANNMTIFVNEVQASRSYLNKSSNVNDMNAHLFPSFTVRSDGTDNIRLNLDGQMWYANSYTLSIMFEKIM